MAKLQKARASVEALLLAASEALGLTRQQVENARSSNTPILARPSQFARFVILRQGHTERLGGGNFMLKGLEARIVPQGERLFERDPLDIAPDLSDAPAEQLYLVTVPPLRDPYAYYVARNLYRGFQVPHNAASEAFRDGRPFTMTAKQLADFLAVNGEQIGSGITDLAHKLRVRPLEGKPSPRVLDVSGGPRADIAEHGSVLHSGDRVQVTQDWNGLISVLPVATAVEDIRAGEQVIVEHSAVAQGLVAKRVSL